MKANTYIVRIASTADFFILSEGFVLFHVDNCGVIAAYNSDIVKCVVKQKESAD